MNHYARESAIQELLSKLIHQGDIPSHEAVLEILHVVRAQLCIHPFANEDGRSKKGRRAAEHQQSVANGTRIMYHALRDLSVLKGEIPHD